MFKLRRTGERAAIGAKYFFGRNLIELENQVTTLFGRSHINLILALWSNT